MWLVNDIIFGLFSLVYLPVLIFKSKGHKDFAQRFGYLPEEVRRSEKKTTWVHAVSVGEVMATRGFIEELTSGFKDARVVLSVTTKTGYESAVKLFSPAVPVFYFPLDFSFAVKKAIDAVRPSLFVVIETELWPNMLAELKRRNIPAVLVNGRISDRSYSGYKFISAFMKPVLGNLTLCLMQSDTDAERIISIGADKQKVKVPGNIKYDTGLFGQSGVNRVVPKTELGIKKESRIFIAGSTHPGEEDIVLQAYLELVKRFPDLRLIIAPRHIDRVQDVQKVCSAYGVMGLRYSVVKKEKTGINPNQAVIIDTIGELKDIYGAGDVVYVGGSLVKRGGHNLIEPARHGKTVLFGPYMHNFRDMQSMFVKKQAGILVRNIKEMELSAAELLSDDKKREELGRRALELVRENQGSVKRIAEIISPFVKGK